MQRQKSAFARQSQGFSLLEVVIVVVIMGIVASIALPGFQAFILGSKISATTNNFVTSVYSARSESIKRGVPAGVCPSANSNDANATCATGADWEQGWIAFADDNENGIRDTGSPGEDLLMQSDAPGAGFVIAPDPVNTNLIYFANDGTSITATGVPVRRSFAISLGSDKEREVTVSANGRVSSKVISD